MMAPLLQGSANVSIDQGDNILSPVVMRIDDSISAGPGDVVDSLPHQLDSITPG
mgnify:FL=1